MKYITEIVDLKKGYDELREDRITVGMATCGISAGADKTYGWLRRNVLCRANCYSNERWAFINIWTCYRRKSANACPINKEQYCLLRIIIRAFIRGNRLL